MEKLFEGINPPAPAELLSQRTYGDRNLLLVIDEEMSNADAGPDGFVPAGLTYVGQMISHDIVPPTNQKSRSFPVETALKLSSVYGPVIAEKLDEYFTEDGLFRLGESWSFKNGQCTAKKGQDIFRDANGEPNIPDSRNDENVIVSQLHLIWQKLHNKIVYDYLGRTHLSRFSKIKWARKVVVKIFHWIAVDEFLRAILDPQVFKLYFEEGKRYIYNENRNFKSLPIEFTHAAFRFGHSMIRDSYILNNPEDPKSLSDLLIKPGSSSLRRCHGETKLDDEFTVDFERFFENPNKQCQMAFKIDTIIANPMSNLQIDSINPHVRNNVSIVTHNVKAGEAVDMPHGESVYKAIKDDFESLFEASEIKKYSKLPEEIVDEVSVKNIYAEDGRVGFVGSPLSNLSSRTTMPDWPLWLYCLAEAQSGSHTHNQGQLGKIASIIVAEVLIQSIGKANPNFFKEYAYYLSKSCEYKHENDDVHAVKKCLCGFPNEIMKEISSEGRLTMFDILSFIEQS